MVGQTLGSPKVEKVLLLPEEPWEELLAKVLPAVDRNYSFLHYHLELQQLRPLVGETMEAYWERFQDYLVVLNIGSDQAGEIFVNSLPDKFQEWATAFCRGKLIPIYAIVEHLHEMAKDPSVKCYVSGGHKSDGFVSKSKNGEEIQRFAKDRPRKRERTEDMSDLSKPRSSKEDQPQKQPIKKEHPNACNRCGKLGHWARECSNNEFMRLSSLDPIASGTILEKSTPSQLRNTKKYRSKGKDSLYVSSVAKVATGEEYSEFPELLRKDTTLSTEKDWEKRGGLWLWNLTNKELLSPSRPVIGKLRWVEVTLHNCVSKRALLDTGAQTSLISEETLREIREQHPNPFAYEHEAIQVQYANNAVEMGSLAEIQLSCQGNHATHTFIVVRKLSDPVILGMDVLEKWPLLTPPAISSQNLQQSLVKVKLADLNKTLDITNQEIGYHHNQPQLLIQLEKELQENLLTAVEYSSIGEITINFREPVKREEGIWRHQVSMSSVGLEQYETQVKRWLEERVIEEIIDLPYWKEKDEEASYQEFISKKGNSRAFWKNGEFNINGFPIYSGKPRIVHNFKPLNDLICDDTCDVPGIDESFWRISQVYPVIFSKIDLKSAYLQIPLRRMDRSLCAFTCGGRRYRFITAPLGLKTIPSQFQRWVKALLQEKGCSEFATNHFDDIVVFSGSVEEHVQHVKKVLQALTSMKLTINESKCVFFATKLPVLGYYLEVGGMSPNLGKLCNMMEWRRPDTRKKVQSLLGILNFFRRFIPNTTSLLCPIMRIREKKFRWEDQEGAEDAYQKAFHLLVKQGPFLFFPIKNIKMELATDASQNAIGAILFQVVEGERRYLGFNSRVLSDAEQRYSTPKKELISILYHMKYYRDYLLGTRFNLYTDAQALSTVLKNLDQPKKNSILAGWLADIGEFDFDVFHIAGVENTLPDLASRVQVVHTQTVRTRRSLPDQEIMKLVEETHALGHWGSTNMFKHITQTLGRTNIPNLLLLCQEMTRKCEPCLKVNRYRVAYAPPRKPELHLPMQYVHLDLFEMSKSKRGYSFVLLAIDQMSGFVWLRPLVTKNMDEVTSALVEVFCSFGFPEKIKSDKGAEFCNQLVRTICEVSSTKQLTTVSYDHHSNGVAERAVRSARDTLEKMIRSLGEEVHRGQWEDLLPTVQFSMNTMVNRVTQTAPFALMFGRHGFPLPKGKDGTNHNLEKSRKIVKDLWKTFFSTVPKTILKMRTSDWRKTYYPHKMGQFGLGDFVYCWQPRSSKSENSYDGPYRVMECKEKGMYILELCEDPSCTKKVPANYLKLAAPPEQNGLLIPKESIDEGVLAGAPASTNGLPPIPAKQINPDSASPNPTPNRKRISRRVKKRVDYAKLEAGEGVDDQSDASHFMSPPHKRKRRSG